MSFLETIASTDFTIVIWAVLGLFIAIILGIVGWLLFESTKYKHKAIIKKPVNGSIRTVFNKFKIGKDKDGNEYYRFYKKPKLYGVIPPLPDEALETDNKGRFVGLWYDIDGSLVPGKDAINTIDKAEMIENTKPLNANQRSIYINQMNKAARDKKQGWKDIVMAAIPIAAVIILVVLNLVLLPDVIDSRAAYDNAKDQAMVSVSENLVVISGNLDRIINDRGLATDDVVGGVPN